MNSINRLSKQIFIAIIFVTILSSLFSQNNKTDSAFLKQVNFIAKDNHSTILTVKKYGYFSISAKSAQGTAIRLVDKYSGPKSIHGIVGQKDGRFDMLLDKGLYKINTFSHKKGSGKLTLSVKSFQELNSPRAPVLHYNQYIEEKLKDLQQISYWIEIKKAGSVYIEASGRALSRICLWQDGSWFTGHKAFRAITEATPGRPMRNLGFNIKLKPGFYKVILYGGLPLKWSYHSNKYPLHMRYGLREISRNSRFMAKISPFGFNRYLIKGKANYFLLQLLKKPKAKKGFYLKVKSLSSYTGFHSYAYTGKITNKSRFPSCKIQNVYARKPYHYLITVEGPVGRNFTLQMKRRTKRPIPGCWVWYQRALCASGAQMNEYMTRTSTTKIGRFSCAASPAYLHALHRQIHSMAAHPWSRGRTFSSLFIGGGTPTICDSKDLADLITTTLTHFHFSKDAEITVESNPNTVSEDKIIALLKAGVNRLSIGVQSFSEKHLRSLGRSHSVEDVKRAVALSQKAGLTNINLDLIYGLPGQSVTEWRQSLKTAMELEPTHLALYELMVEEGTPLARSLAAGKCRLPHEDDVADMEEITATLCKNGGFDRYEISNFAKPGFQCRHNIIYWKNQSWLGMGAGAVASLSGTKISQVADPATYTRLIENKKEPIAKIECLSRQALFRETIIMGLRLLEGVSISELKKRFELTPQEYYGEELNRLISQGLLTLSEDMMRLTPAALPVANQVLSRLV